MIDTHCHLNFKAFKNDYREVYERALKAGVEKIIVVGTSIASSRRAVEIATELDGCYAAVGIHPHHVNEFITIGHEQVKKELTRLAREKKVIALGETGIDYYQYKGYPKVTEIQIQAQKDLLLLHLELAKAHDLPVIFHCREAMVDMIKFLGQAFKQLNFQPKGVFHCFHGTETELQKVLDMGMYVGFDGNISYEEHENLQELVKKAPLDRLLLETDAPYLTPLPHRGSRNEPGHLPVVARWVAKINETHIETVARQTTTNARVLFQF